jgi:hypothetical protein
VKRATMQRVASPTAFLVAIPEPMATTAMDGLADGGLRVMKVGHVAAACERMPIVMPQLVVVLTTLLPEEADTLADRCVAVGAELLKLAPETSAEALRPMLKEAAQMALVRALRRA